MKFSKEEVQRVFDLIRGATTIAEVIERIGPPDREFGPIRTRAHHPEIYGDRRASRVLRQLDYTRLSETVVLNVQELEGGGIQKGAGGKPRKSR